MAILAMVSTVEKPDQKVVTDLVNTLADLSRDGHISNREILQLKVYLKRTLKSANVSNQEIKELENMTFKSINKYS